MVGEGQRQKETERESQAGAPLSMESHSGLISGPELKSRTGCLTTKPLRHPLNNSL